MIDFELFGRDDLKKSFITMELKEYLNMHIFMRIVWMMKYGILSSKANILEKLLMSIGGSSTSR